MDRLDELQALVAIAESGAMGAAAERLGIAPSGVTRRLAALEARLGVQLVRRTTRRLDLTEAGRELHGRALRILEELDDAEHAVQSGSASLSGTLRIAAPLSFGVQHLGPALSDFMAAHPGLAVDLELDDAHVDLIAGGRDVALRIADLEDSSLAARRLTSVHLVACAAPAYLERNGIPAHPSELRAHACLRYSNTPGQSWVWRGADGSSGAVEIAGPLVCSNGDVLLQAARAGHGVVLEPDFILHDAIRAGDLQQILTDFVWREIGVWAVWPSSRMLPRRVRAFVDFLVDQFGDEPPWRLS